MNKDLNISILMDFYGQLLTEKQLEALALYYNEDLSLAEIAEETGISRQGVRDSIKRGERQLEEFEEKLGLYRKLNDFKIGFERINSVIDTLSVGEADADKIREIKEIANSLSDEL